MGDAFRTALGIPDSAEWRAQAELASGATAPSGMRRDAPHAQRMATLRDFLVDRYRTLKVEQRGWSGVLIEPQPDLAEELRRERRAKVYAVACSNPASAGKTLTLYLAGIQSSLKADFYAAGMQRAQMLFNAATLGYGEVDKCVVRLSVWWPQRRCWRPAA